MVEGRGGARSENNKWGGGRGAERKCLRILSNSGSSGLIIFFSGLWNRQFARAWEKRYLTLTTDSPTEESNVNIFATQRWFELRKLTQGIPGTSFKPYSHLGKILKMGL